jgi:hypothetical protein
MCIFLHRVGIRTPVKSRLPQAFLCTEGEVVVQLVGIRITLTVMPLHITAQRIKIQLSCQVRSRTWAPKAGWLIQQADASSYRVGDNMQKIMDLYRLMLT